jgi:hypothetical protein
MNTIEQVVLSYIAQDKQLHELKRGLQKENSYAILKSSRVFSNTLRYGLSLAYRELQESKSKTAPQNTVQDTAEIQQTASPAVENSLRVEQPTDLVSGLLTPTIAPVISSVTSSESNLPRDQVHANLASPTTPTLTDMSRYYDTFDFQRTDVQTISPQFLSEPIRVLTQEKKAVGSNRLSVGRTCLRLSFAATLLLVACSPVEGIKTIGNLNKAIVKSASESSKSVMIKKNNQTIQPELIAPVVADEGDSQNIEPTIYIEPEVIAQVINSNESAFIRFNEISYPIPEALQQIGLANSDIKPYEFNDIDKEYQDLNFKDLSGKFSHLKGFIEGDIARFYGEHMVEYSELKDFDPTNSHHIDLFNKAKSLDPYFDIRLSNGIRTLQNINIDSDGKSPFIKDDPMLMLHQNVHGNPIRYRILQSSGREKLYTRNTELTELKTIQPIPVEESSKPTKAPEKSKKVLLT